MGSAGRRLLRSSRPARLHMVVTVVLGLGAAALIIAQAGLLARIIDRAFMRSESLDELQGTLVALVLVAVGRSLLAAGFEGFGRAGAARVMAQLRARLVDHLLRARPGGLRAERTGELANAAVQGVDALESYFARYLPQLVLGALVPPVILLWLVPVDLPAALVLAVTLPLIPVFMVLIGRSAQDRTRARWRAQGVLSGHFLDVVRGLDTLRVHNRAQAQEKTLAAVSDRLRRETMGTLRVAFLSALVLELLAMLGVALVAATVGIQLVEGSLTLEAGLTVLILAPELYAPLRQVGAQFHASADGVAAAERIFALLDAPPAVALPSSPRPAPDPGSSTVRLEGVSFSWPERPGQVLSEVDLELGPGELVALAGPSGAGKSTLAALLLRFADPSTGRVSCAGVDLREVDPAAWRRRVTWVPQRPRLFRGTVADNVRLGAPDAPLGRVCEAVRAAGAEAVVAALPAGLDTPLGEGGRALSAGQAQRIALARAFVRAAPLTVLDEPTAHLDAAAAGHVLRSVSRLAQRSTVLVIVHRPELVSGAADRIIELDGGRLRVAGVEPVAA